MKGRGHGALRHKLVRDMRQSAMQFLAMMLLCALGTWVFAGLDATWRMQETTIETWLAEGNLCDLWLRSTSFTRQDLLRIRHTQGIREVVKRVTLDCDAPELSGTVTCTIHAYDGPMTLNTPRIRSGSALQPGDGRGCLVEEQFAEAHGLKSGDSIILRILDADRHFIVRGTCLSPEYLITAKDMAPDPSIYGFILLQREALPDFPCNELLIRLEEETSFADVSASLASAVPNALILDQSVHGSTVQGRNYISLFRSMSYLFPVLAYFVAALMLVSTIVRMMDTQRVQMGTLKALGYSSGRIRRHYLAYALWPALIGSAIGMAAAQFTIPQIIWRMVATNTRVPEIRMAPVSPLSRAMAAAEVFMSLLIGLRHVRRAERETAADLLRPKPPRSGARILLERIGPLWRRFSFNAKMIVRNTLRNKGRTFMAMVGMLFCNMLIICSFGLQESIPYFVGAFFSETLAYDVRADLKSGQAGDLHAYRSRIEAERVDGLMEVSATMSTADTSRSIQLIVLPEDTELYHLDLTLPDHGAVLSRKLAEKLNVDTGAAVRMRLTGDTKEITLEVTGIAEINIGQGAYMSLHAWESLRKGAFTPTALLFRSLSSRGQQTLDAMDEVERFTYPVDQQAQTMRIMESAAGAFSLLSAVALGLAFIICYNMGLLNFSERVREYATLKVLGYHQREIRRLMLRENDLTAIFGVAAGISPGIMLVRIILKMCEFDSMIFVPHLTWPTIAWSSLATFAFTWLIEWLLTQKVRSIDMVEALKSVE